MTKKEYKQLCLTGSSEPDRRKSQVIYEPRGAAPPPNQMVGYGKRIVHIPKEGNPRVIRVGKKRAAKLDAYHAR